MKVDLHKKKGAVERPILMSAPMVRAILDGRKTQTRRVVKIPRKGDHDYHLYDPMDGKRGDPPWPCRLGGDGRYHKLACPYGAPGDRLWVREEHYRIGHWEKVTGIKARTRKGRQRWRFVVDGDRVLYSDDPPKSFRKGRHAKDPERQAWHKRLARFMPRALSRITLEIESVRVERLHDITAKDILAEGAVLRPHEVDGLGKCPVSAFDGCCYPDLRSVWASGWAKINGVDSWKANPWVWVIEFSAVRG